MEEKLHVKNGKLEQSVNVKNFLLEAKPYIFLGPFPILKPNQGLCAKLP